MFIRITPIESCNDSIQSGICLCTNDNAQLNNLHCLGHVLSVPFGWRRLCQ